MLGAYFLTKIGQRGKKNMFCLTALVHDVHARTTLFTTQDDFYILIRNIEN